MEDWSLDVINAYCQEHFNGDYQCVIAEGKGRILVSRKDILQGELLFAEPPLHIVQEDDENPAFQLVKRLCKEQPDVFAYEPLWYWTALCSLTAEQLGAGPEVGSLPAVTLQQQRRLLCLFHEPVQAASEAVEALVARLALTAPALVIEELLQAWILNCFEHSDEPLGYSAYFASSFISHSCGANAIWIEGDAALHMLRAREPISRGDEITISYLDESVLLHCAEARKKVLQETKHFECTCHRCAPAPGVAGAVDPCRGFHCRHCGANGVFHRIGLDSVLTAPSARLAPCRSCGREVAPEEVQRLLQCEAKLDKEVTKLDQRKGSWSRADDERVQRLLAMVASGCDGPVGPQHWLCERLWEHLESYFKARDMRGERERMLEHRVRYQSQVYPGLSGALAWLLERQADTLHSHHGSDPHQHKGLRHILELYAESMRMLGLLFGTEHEYYTDVEKKHTAIQQLLLEAKMQ